MAPDVRPAASDGDKRETGQTAYTEREWGTNVGEKRQSCDGFRNGNETTFNLGDMLYTNIMESEYFFHIL